MGGSADRPATPAFLRASDAERDHVVDELRKEYVDGRLSHETFILRMETALGARNHGQLARLFTDLPPRRARLLARVKAALLGWGRRDQDERPATQVIPGMPGYAQEAYAPVEYSAAWAGRPEGSPDPPPPSPLVFPPGSGTVFTIGRTQDCDLRISDMSVSRHHAQLTRTDDGWLLSDMGSHNGTRINGWLVREPVPLRPGDTVQFGSATFIVQDNPPRQLPPQAAPDPAAPVSGDTGPGGPGGSGGVDPPQSRGVPGGRPPGSAHPPGTSTANT
jgi:pSer/pThr/pTyr-binding forkhead associated (FHA) protein